MKPVQKPKQIFRLAEILDLIPINWPRLFLLIFLGAALGFGYTILKPPVYESFAVVQVDHNAEEALVDNIWKLGVRREYFLEEQTRLLEGVATSDEVLTRLIEILQAQDLPVPQNPEELFGNAFLPHPAQGNWRFVFREADPEVAAVQANAWAEAFVAVVQEKLIYARQLRSQKVQTAYYAGQLASQELLCAQLPDLSGRIEGRAQTLQEEDPAAETEILGYWWLEEITASAGFFQNPEMYTMETNAETLEFLRDLKDMVEDKLVSCPGTMESMRTTLEISLAAETDLIQAGAGLNPYLEVVLKKEATPALRPTVKPGRVILLGGTLGLIAGIIWLLFILVQGSGDEKAS
ncbi:MAG: hypothetical protein JXA25_20400 [Anaerolineales bacterium]|nr:hypothetical protein [Anaerolineales bacterium]